MSIPKKTGLALVVFVGSFLAGCTSHDKRVLTSGLFENKVNV